MCKKVFSNIFTENIFFSFVIGVVYLILRHYANGNYFLSRNGFRAPITTKWLRSDSSFCINKDLFINQEVLKTLFRSKVFVY